MPIALSSLLDEAATGMIQRKVQTKEYGLVSLTKYAVPCAALVLLLLWCSPAMSSTTGKIAGIVQDAKTGEPLAGASVRVEGSQMATQTDADGEFYIINLPVGEYTLTVTILGYESYILKEIRVLTDLTTPVEFPLQSSPIQINESMTVVAHRPLIQKDKISSGTIMTRVDISSMAASRSIYTILSSMNGTVMTSDSGMHVRGGRRGTVTYAFDDFSIQDPFDNTLGMRIIPDALEELSLTSGGLEPEYGQALSGVVNAVTREGGETFRGRLKSYSGMTHTYDVQSGDYGALRSTADRTMELDLSGPIIKIGDRWVTFFGSGEMTRNNGYLPHSKLKLNTGIGKLVMFPTGKTKLQLEGAYDYRDQQRYVHRDINGRCYDFNLDGLGKIQSKAYLVGLTGSYNKSANTVFEMRLNHFRTRTKQAPESLFDLHWDQWPGYSVNSNGVYNGHIQDSNYQLSQEYNYIGFTSGNDFYPYYLERMSAYSGAQFSVLSQVDKYNQLKIGGEGRHYELYWDNRQFFNVLPYGETYRVFPWTGAGYVQDKMEFNDLIVNLGVRFDYEYSDVSYWHDAIIKDYQKHSKPKTQWSPRFGISHPVSANSNLYFNYGYLFQQPSYRLMYTNLSGNLNTGYPLIGNPDLEPEKSIYYELGWNQILNDAVKINLNTYYRDITKLVGSRDIIDEKLNTFTVFTNSDYGEVKGFDLDVESIGRRLLNWSLNYSYMIAEGNASDPYEGYYSYATVTGNSRPPWPVHSYPLAFDQRHKLTAVVDFQAGRHQQLEFLGVKLPDAWDLNIEAQYGSGLPYTRTDAAGNRIGSLNGERMPYSLVCNLRAQKDFFLSSEGKTSLSMFVEVENMFNRRNIINLYQATGLADRDGNYALNVSTATSDQERRWYELYSEDAQHYDYPRQLRLGMEINF